MKKVLSIIAVVVGICAVAYVGSCAYVNFINPSSTNAQGEGLPAVKDAPYMVVIRNTHSVYYAPKYDRYGKGGEVVLLHGYFEQVGKEYVYRNKELPLDESKFGPIDVIIRKTGG